MKDKVGNREDHQNHVDQQKKVLHVYDVYSVHYDDELMIHDDDAPELEQGLALGHDDGDVLSETIAIINHFAIQRLYVTHIDIPCDDDGDIWHAPCDNNDII